MQLEFVAFQLQAKAAAAANSDLQHRSSASRCDAGISGRLNIASPLGLGNGGEGDHLCRASRQVGVDRTRRACCWCVVLCHDASHACVHGKARAKQVEQR